MDLGQDLRKTKRDADADALDNVEPLARSHDPHRQEWSCLASADYDHYKFVLYELTHRTISEVDLDVTLRPRATDQNVSLCWLFQRLGLILNCPGNQSRFASMADTCSTGPPYRDVAGFRELQQAVPILTPLHC
jgi:hypothetical protein